MIQNSYIRRNTSLLSSKVINMAGAMKPLFCFLAVCIGSAIATLDFDERKWTAEILRGLTSRSNRLAYGEVVPTVPELIVQDGYSVEIHHVVTEDGYILEAHRIPASPASPAAKNKPVAFLMHGLLSSSADWIITGPEKGLAYILADAGYDVWLGNARGNTWSKNHTGTPTEREFWDFTWHEIGLYDLPALIDYALEKTGQDQVVYIGHSQGTTSFYVMTSERPAYNDKIKVMFALAPVAYMGNLYSPVLRLAALGTGPLSVLLQLVGVYEFLPSQSNTDAAATRFCDPDELSQSACTNVLFLLAGFNEEQMNTTLLPTIFLYTPAGAATRQLVHYGQEINSRRFRQFDHGRIDNMRIYGRWTPPDYDLSLVTAPVHLIYSLNDWMSAPVDVHQLHRELGNPAALYQVSDPRWNHLDYLWGIDARDYVYEYILTTLKTV